MRYLAFDDADGVEKGKVIGVAVSFQGGLVHEASDGEVGQQQAVELLADQLGRLGARSTSLAEAAM